MLVININWDKGYVNKKYIYIKRISKWSFWVCRVNRNVLRNDRRS